MEEPEHIVHVLESVKKGVIEEDAQLLHELSNQTIHCASTVQDPGSISIAVLVYALSKIVERKNKLDIKNWKEFSKKLNGILDLAMLAARENDEPQYNAYLAQARKCLTSLSVNLKPAIEEILKKASVNKASKIYEHGISLGQTANILGVTQWELSEYLGQTNADVMYGKSLSIVQRAKMAQEFFNG
ncbi:MAG TPA: hypothetical protein VJK51_03020 [Candidatus Nanoarchaeia archaeon]|nr:hypothetical protein [Candidatus Nanoarchaeia archaeon]